MRALAKPLNAFSAMLRISIEIKPVSAEGHMLPQYDNNVLPKLENIDDVRSWLEPTGSDSNKQSASHLRHIGTAVIDGIQDGLYNGPLYGYPVSGISVDVTEGSLSAVSHDVESDPGTLVIPFVSACLSYKLFRVFVAASLHGCIRAAATRATQSALRQVCIRETLGQASQADFVVHSPGVDIVA